MKKSCKSIMVASGLVLINLFLASDSFASEAGSFARQGAAALAIKDYDLAIVFFSKAIDCATNYSYAYYARGLAYFGKGQYQKSIEDSFEAVRTDSVGYTSGYAFEMRGGAYLKLNKITNALEAYKMAIQHNSTNSEFYVNRGGIYYAMGILQSATNDFGIAICLNSNSPTAYYAMASAKGAAFDFRGAVVDYSKSIHLDPSNMTTYFSRAAVYTALEDYTNAISDYDMVLKTNTSNVTVLAIIGMLKSKLGQFETGIKDCQEAVAIEPNSAIANNNLAWLLAVAPDVKLRNGTQSVMLAKKACELTMWTNAYSLGTLAAASAEAGKLDEAVKWQSESIKLGLKGNELIEANRLLDMYKQGKPYSFQKANK